MLDWTAPGRCTSVTGPGAIGGTGGGSVPTPSAVQPASAASTVSSALAGVRSPTSTSTLPAGTTLRRCRDRTFAAVSAWISSSDGRAPPYGGAPNSPRGGGSPAPPDGRGPAVWDRPTRPSLSPPPFEFWELGGGGTP